MSEIEKEKGTKKKSKNKKKNEAEVGYSEKVSSALARAAAAADLVSAIDFVEGEDEAPSASEELELADVGDDSVLSESAETRETGEPIESESSVSLDGTELEGFEAATIEDVETLTDEQIRSVVESVLFATDKPLSIAVIKQAFKGTQVKSKDIREALQALEGEYTSSPRGFSLVEAGGGFSLRTKSENMKYLRQSVKPRPFKLSGPALEVLSIVAYKQPTTKSQIDEIRGVESGHLLRALMEKNLVNFGERSDLPGKPMFYETTRKFLEIFGLRNLNELPSLHEIDQLIPEGIGLEEEKETLGDITQSMSEAIGSTYSEGEDELLKITYELNQISTSSEFFEQEKERMREKRDADRAQNLREALAVGETVDDKDRRWLERYEESLVARAQGAAEVDIVTDGLVDSGADAVVAAANEATIVLTDGETVMVETGGFLESDSSAMSDDATGD